jgi:flagellar biosynthesis/type III secretory pathway ATPase
MPAITTDEHRHAAHRLLDMMATYREAEDLINIGAYVKGSNPRIDEALRNWEKIRSFLRQRAAEKTDFDESIAQLTGIMAD